MCADYTGLFRWVWDWQTLIAGILAIVGAILGGWLAYRGAQNQIVEMKRQNADLKLADKRRLAQERKAVAGLLYASVGIIITQIDLARSGLIDPLPTLRANAIRQAIGKPGFTYLWKRAWCL